MKTLFDIFTIKNKLVKKKHKMLKKDGLFVYRTEMDDDVDGKCAVWRSEGGNPARNESSCSLALIIKSTKLMQMSSKTEGCQDRNLVTQKM